MMFYDENPNFIRDLGNIFYGFSLFSFVTTPIVVHYGHKTKFDDKGS